MKNFIPKPYKAEQISFRIDVQKLEQVDKAAQKFQISRNEFINQCIDFAMEHMPSPEGAREKEGKGD